MSTSSGCSKVSTCMLAGVEVGQQRAPCCQCCQSPSIEKREAETQWFAVPGCHSTHIYGMSDTQPGSHSTHQQHSVCVPPSPQAPLYCPEQYRQTRTVFQSEGPQKSSLCPAGPRKPKASRSLECVHVCLYEADSLCKHTPWHLYICVHIWLCVQSWECLVHPTQMA